MERSRWGRGRAVAGCNRLSSDHTDRGVDMADAELSYTSGTSEVPLLGRTIGDDLHRTIARFGDREALVDRPTGRRWTYRQLGEDVDALARGLLTLGIDTGDRVGIWAPNCAEWVLTQYATAEIGAILVNINPAYRTHELAYVLRQSGVRLLVSATSFKTTDYRAMVSEVAGECPMVERTVFIGTSGWDELVAGGDLTPMSALV